MVLIVEVLGSVVAVSVVLVIRVVVVGVSVGGVLVVRPELSI